MKSIFIELNIGVVIPAWILDGRLWVMDAHSQTITPFVKNESWWTHQEEVLAVAEQIKLSYDGGAGIIAETDVPPEKNIHCSKLPDFWPCPQRIEKLKALRDCQDEARENLNAQILARLERAAGIPTIKLPEFLQMLPQF